MAFHMKETFAIEASVWDLMQRTGCPELSIVVGEI